MTDSGFVQSPSGFCFPFTNAFYGLVTGWIRELNPKDYIWRARLASKIPAVNVVETTVCVCVLQ